MEGLLYMLAIITDVDYDPVAVANEEQREMEKHLRDNGVQLEEEELI